MSCGTRRIVFNRTTDGSFVGRHQSYRLCMRPAKNPPVTLRLAMLGCLLYVAPFIALSLPYLAIGAFSVAFPSRLDENNVYAAGIGTIGLLIFALGGAIAGIAFGLIRGLQARSVVAWIMALGVLGLGAWFDLPNTFGHPWWVGLNVRGDFSWFAIAMSADVHLLLIALITAFLLSRPTLKWLFGSEARHDRLPWKLQSGK